MRFEIYKGRAIDTKILVAVNQATSPERIRGGFIILLIHAHDIKKQYGDRIIVSISDLKIYKGDRVGIVGLNGAGKTTLMDILAGDVSPDQGYVKRYSEHSYIRQFGINDEASDEQYAKIFDVKDKNLSFLSGGELTRMKAAGELSRNKDILFADEPTCNLDFEGIALIEKYFSRHSGALILISHDRQLLDTLCSMILEISDGEVRSYTGNYSDYLEQKETERKKMQTEHEKYQAEKAELLNAISILKTKSGKMRKTPKRMGNSEARLHKRRSTETEEKLHGAVKAIETRLSKLAEKSKPEEAERIKVNFRTFDSPVSKILIKGEDINVSFGERTLFDSLEFSVEKGKKTALIGKNGTGKTTLIKLILSGDDRIKIAQGVRIAYFSQDLDTIDDSASVLQNVLKESSYPEWLSRTILARLLFGRDEINKKASVLSGGERVKLAIAKILVSDANLLILDEPTNYLDIFSLEALQSVLQEYKGTMLFTSHDRRFVDAVADKKILIDGCKAKLVNDFSAGHKTERNKEKQKVAFESIMQNKQEATLLEFRLSEVLGKLSAPGKGDDPLKLDEEFKSIIARLKEIKK